MFQFSRHEIYEERPEYLYQTFHGDDHVIVAMRPETAESIALQPIQEEPAAIPEE